MLFTFSSLPFIRYFQDLCKLFPTPLINDQLKHFNFIFLESKYLRGKKLGLVWKCRWLALRNRLHSISLYIKEIWDKIKNFLKNTSFLIEIMQGLECTSFRACGLLFKIFLSQIILSIFESILMITHNY